MNPRPAHLRPEPPTAPEGAPADDDREARWDGVTRPRTRHGELRLLTDVIVELGMASGERVAEAVEAARSGGVTTAEALLRGGAPFKVYGQIR